MKGTLKYSKLCVSLLALFGLLSASLTPGLAQEPAPQESSAQATAGGPVQPARTSPWARLPDDLTAAGLPRPEVDPGQLYLAASWENTAIYFLDAALNPTGSFPTGTSNPNGLAATGYLIFSADFDTQSIRIFDYEGNLIYEWFDSRLLYVQGLEVVNEMLAFYEGGGFMQVHFFTYGGTYLYSIPAPESVEGLAYDGTLLWTLADVYLIGINPASGSVVKTIPNPAVDCVFDGSALSTAAAGELLVGCTGGEWYKVSTADGTLLASGNNGIDMFGLASSTPILMDPVYIRSEVGAPWGTTSNEDAMNAVFGSGFWQDLRYETVDPLDLFSPDHHLIFMEGSDDNAEELEVFLTANQALLEEWVGYGGCLLLNAAPNEGDGMSLGFDGVVLDYTYPDTQSITGVAVDPAHAIFNGPFVPITGTVVGTAFAHATVSGGGVTNLISGDNDLIPLAEKDWGQGHAAFGGMTTTNFHDPQPEAFNLRANLLYYLTTFGCQVNFPPEAQPDGTLFLEDFEYGLDRWTATGLWNLEAQDDTCGALVDPFPSPTQAAYYGDDSACSYDVGYVTGTLTLNSPVLLPAGGQPLLTFHSYAQTENDCATWDFRFVQVSDDGGSTWDTLGNLCTENTWDFPAYSLSAYAGDSLLLRFLFDPLDADVNNFFGWMLDNIAITYYPHVYTSSTFFTRADTAFVTPSVLSNDFDPYSSEIFVESFDDSTLQGTLVLDDDGTFFYDPNGAFGYLLEGEQALDTFSYTVSDGAYQDTVQVYILVQGVDDPPLAVADSYSVRNDRTLNVAAPGVMANDYDPDGEPVTAFLGSGPGVGTLNFNNTGAFTYLPVADFVGDTFFTYVVNSGLQWSNIITPRASFSEPEFVLGTPVDGYEVSSLFGEPIPTLTFNFDIGGTPSLSATFTTYGPGVTSFVSPPHIEGPSAGTLWVDFGVDVYSASFGFVESCNSGYLPDAIVVTLYSASMNPLDTLYFDAGNTGFNWVENLAQIDTGTAFRSLSIDFNDACQSFAIDNLSYFTFTPPTFATISVTPSEFVRFLPMTTKH